jgi:hypothetical protein
MVKTGTLILGPESWGKAWTNLSQQWSISKNFFGVNFITLIYKLDIFIAML